VELLLIQPRFPISFGDGRVALAVRARPGADLAKAIRGMGLTTGVPTIVPVTAGSRPGDLQRLVPLLEKVVVPVAEALDATVVDEGTRGGMAGLLATARARKKAGFPLLGVAPDGAGGAGPDPATLDPEYSHFVLVPAYERGVLARWVAAVATAVAGGNRSVALVAAGGEPAWDSVTAHVAAGRLVMAVARSGGVADRLAAALRGGTSEPRATSLAASGQVCAVDPGRGASFVADSMRSALSRPDAIPAGPSPAGR
jgi:hypothetical protein